MSFQLSEVKREAEFRDLVETEYLAYQKPYNAFWEVLKGPNVEECTQRQWSWHTGTKGSHWLKVTENENVIGGAEWIVHEKAPFETPQPIIKADWWPEGPLKSVSNHMLYTFFSGRPSVMNRPHLHYRRRGVGRLMMEWGCKLADEMGLQCFVESTDDGRELYKSAGFVAVHPFFLDAQPSNEQEGDNPEWLEAKEKITPEPYRVWLMWRPEGGVFKDGKIGFPWEG
ncbi:hypothetical protein HYFRA_00001847 [Hymenoscyphus fraxineus]|uniref:N-acetyltransferase domain-containing protein n=1 Tax=Hymenoscyphus fraxineus TaxID=746836 RepID=A0A9N9PJK5_9HELO|nr:hypothetical protein HYFRA_00001847 [Hymenoscyphus fraxineus]